MRPTRFGWRCSAWRPTPRCARRWARRHGCTGSRSTPSSGVSGTIIAPSREPWTTQRPAGRFRRTSRTLVIERCGPCSNAAACRSPWSTLLQIRLNGEAHDLDWPLSISALLAALQIDSRRVAVEHNLVVVKRAKYDEVVVRDGDEVEIVNFVGGG